MTKFRLLKARLFKQASLQTPSSKVLGYMRYSTQASSSMRAKFQSRKDGKLCGQKISRTPDKNTHRHQMPALVRLRLLSEVSIGMPPGTGARALLPQWELISSHSQSWVPSPNPPHLPIQIATKINCKQK